MGYEIRPRLANASRPTPDETLIRALGRPHRWKRMLEYGRYQSAGEIAEAERFDRSFVNRLLRLTLLAPDIQEAILDGPQQRGIKLVAQLRRLPLAWDGQRLEQRYRRSDAR